MLTPRYYFTEDFSRFYECFLAQPHRKRTLQKGEYLWEPDKLMQKIHYIISGIARTEIEHENGRRKIISFHGSGTLFPGYHQTDFKIEQSILTKAVSDMEVLEFTRAGFGRIVEQNRQLNAALIEWYSKYVNLLLYETAHQEYNSSFVKLCNLLHLLLTAEIGEQGGALPVTQEELSDILGLSRVHLTKGLARLREEKIIETRRKRIVIINPQSLADYCSLETV